MIKYLAVSANEDNFTGYNKNHIGIITWKDVKNLENRITSFSLKNLPKKMIKYLSIILLYNKMKFKYTKGIYIYIYNFTNYFYIQYFHIFIF